MYTGQIFDLSKRLVSALIQETKAGIYTSKSQAFSGVLALDLPESERLIALMSPKRARVFLVSANGTKKLVYEKHHEIKLSDLDILPSLPSLEASLIAQAKYREYMSAM